MATFEGNISTKIPQIDTENFGLWANLFECYVRGKSRKIWDIIKNGDFKPTKTKDGIVSEKPVAEWSAAEDAWVCLNFEAKNILFSALTKDEIERVYSCESAHDIWENLNNTHRGNSQVKSSKINILVHDYELFEMSKDESIDSMFKRFNLIVTALKGLGRVYPNEDYVRKILRALPSEWMPKITSLEDSRDLSLMKLDDLIGNLKVHEIALKRNKEREHDKKKSLALKASIPSDEKEKKKKKEKASSSKDQSEHLDDVAMLVRNFSKFLANKRFSRNDRFQRKGDYRRGGENRSRKFHKRNDKMNKDGKSSDDEEVKKKKGVCYSCGDKDHYANECPKRGKPKKNENAFVGGAWSASEDEDEHETICLMAESDDEVNSCSSSYSSDDECDDDDLDMLNDAFQQMVMLTNNYKNENEKLKEALSLCKKEINDDKQKIACDNEIIAKLETKLGEKDFCKSCDVLNKKIACLEKGLVENNLCAKCDNLKNDIACLKEKCDKYEKDNLLAHAFNTSNEKVLKMLKISNSTNCRKGIGSDACNNKCSCLPIKRFYEPPKHVETRKSFVQKPLCMPYVNNVKTRKPYACMYNNKFSRPRNNVNMHAPFYVFDKYNREIKMVKRWIPKGTFSVDNPGGMRLWV